MLKKFSVTNFKNFKDKITFDLGSPCNYEFNSDVIIDNCTTKGIIYGPNGSGKSNLGLAIFDIILHLTDKEKLYNNYRNYLNMDSTDTLSKFEYTFLFDNIELNYNYGKYDAETLAYETLVIDGMTYLEYNFDTKQGSTILPGAETLNLKSESSISRVKYIKNNAILYDTQINKIFNKFTTFVDNMLLFYSLKSNGYQGFTVGTDKVSKGIIEKEKVSDFESFLKSNGISYNLYGKTDGDEKNIYCHFKNKDVEFFDISSTGTTSLALFYYWYIKMQDASFVFIDEFDAFYHYELAIEIVKLLKSMNNIQIMLTTHNTDLMSNDLLRPDCYFLIENNRIIKISEATDKELRKAHNLQKMYKAGAFFDA